MQYRGILIFLVLVAATSVNECEGAKILGLFNVNGRSHFIMFESLLKGLAARGHQVYVVGHFPLKNPMPINKSQGQSLSVYGITLENPCFSHGQLYGACSRVGKPSTLFIFAPENRTKNIVYQKALN